MDICSPGLQRWRVNKESLCLLPVVNVQFRELISSYIVLVAVYVRAVATVTNDCCDFVATDTTVANAFCMIYKNQEFDALSMW